MPAVTNGMILEDELRCYGSAEAQAERSCRVELLISKCANRVGRGLAVRFQKSDRISLRATRVVLRVARVQLGDVVPRDAYLIPGGDTAGKIDLDRIDARNVMNG